MATAPLVGQLDDNNGDGRVNNLDTADVIVVPFAGGILWLDGPTGAVLDAFESVGGRYDGFSQPLLANVVGDGQQEIVVFRQRGFNDPPGGFDVVALDLEGNVIWASHDADGAPSVARRAFIGEFNAIYAADLDADGAVEVLADDLVIDGETGLVELRLPFTAAGNLTHTYSTAADADLDGDQEIVYGNQVFDHLGTPLFSTVVANPPSNRTVFPTFFNADADPQAEVGIMHAGSFDIYEIDSEGTDPEHITIGSAGFNSPICIADFDGDGLNEYVYGNGVELVAWDDDRITPLWDEPVPAPDPGSPASCSGYDLDGDGAFEVLFTVQTALMIVDGASGQVLFSTTDEGSPTEHSALTFFEYPTVADVDGDGRAEILFGRNGDFNGVAVLTGGDPGWSCTTSTWTVYDQRDGNLLPDGTVPRVDPQSWRSTNRVHARGVWADYCGDGEITEDEECDDGGNAEGDGCDGACAEEDGWSCDEAEPTVCTEICDDELVVGAEQCDLGALLNGAAGQCCSDTCTFIEVETPCASDDEECTIDACDGEGTCAHFPVEPGTDCGADETACFSAGACTEVGTCLVAPKEEGTACGSDEVTECSGADICDGEGVCSPNDFDAGEACGSNADTECDNPDTCNGTGLCVTNNVADGTECTSDDVFCTGVEECTGGACVSPGDPCDPETETCAEDLDECIPQCGDGMLDEEDEDCDDGNTDDLDGCSSTCAEEVGWVCTTPEGEASVCVSTCGDGELAEGAEECEDENVDEGDGCDDECAVEPGWDCPLDEETALSDCAPICGDGLVRGDEACDDENEDNGDGCSDVCVVEDGFICDDSEPSVCARETSCGDGAVDAGESCDDGDEDNGDGCSSACAVEEGFICDDSEPTVCLPDGDEDTVVDDDDNCPDVANSDQADQDEDLIGDACDDDRDGDGVDNEDEPALGTNPDDPDSDDDGLSDGDEVDRGTIPTNPDSDGGGVPDGEEVAEGTDPRPGHPDDDFNFSGGGLSGCAQVDASELGPLGLMLGLLWVGALRRRRTR